MKSLNEITARLAVKLLKIPGTIVECMDGSSIAGRYPLIKGQKYTVERAAISCNDLSLFLKEVDKSEFWPRATRFRKALE